jgi:hypothetical protein
MGLQEQNMWHFHAWLRFKCAQKISTWRPKASATHPIQIYHTRLRRQNSVCNKRWNTATHGQTMSHNTKSHRIRFVLCTSGGTNRPNATKWHCSGTNKINWKNTGRHKSIVRLFGHSPGRHHQISCLRHDITHPQWCLVTFSFKRTQPSRRPVFLRRQIPTTR